MEVPGKLSVSGFGFGIRTITSEKYIIPVINGFVSCIMIVDNTDETEAIVPLCDALSAYFCVVW